ncbi:MAG: hypothetical protein M1834_004542 [Cirrosporium novae-zelandiae]|nr:MAG: hypothetical protein M1834_004542 [Cirrosporium novae-zelandiae]
MTDRLKSEKPLAQRNLEDSSQNYDKQLLSKFGKPPSPSRLSNYGSLGPEVSPKNRFPFQLKSPSSLEISSIQSDSVSSRWPGSPKSVAISPGGGRTCWDYRSPSTDESSAPSSAIDPELRKASRGSLPSILDDTSSLVSRSQRGSYDQTNCEVDRPLDETGRIGQLHIGERTEGNSGSKQGMKRRASSPVQDVWREDNKVSLQNLNGSNSGARRPSPVHRLHPNHGSVSSSTSSMMGIRNGSLGSLGSSMALSVGSSMTSMSGFERFSPGGISPSSEAEFGQQMQESPYQTAASLNPSPRQSLSRAHPNQQTVPTLGIPSVGLSTKHPQHPQQSSVTSSTSDRQPSVTAMSVDPSLNGNPYAIQPPKMQGGYFCECCQKKPKKFNTLEELQAHRDEKQYTCQYCHNRFKNKNEAERHQNSLHLRRHSWSCAALSSYQAAFHPSPHPSTLTPAGPTVDLCGYCGMGFPYPPDWEQRYDHLTTSHKFGECNQSKKFYRADHFRQHLKHSHAGTSGKWTNMLENACMRDETPQSERLGSLSSEAGRGAGSSSGTPIMTKTINEVHDES